MDSETLESVVVEPKNASETELVPSATLNRVDHSSQTTIENNDIETSETHPSLEARMQVEDGTRVEIVGRLSRPTQETQKGESMASHEDHQDKEGVDEVVKSVVVAHENARNPATSTRTFYQTVSLVPAFVNTDIYATGICCQTDLTSIRSILGKLPGVESVDASLVTKNVHIKHDPYSSSPADLLSSLNDKGFQASLGRRATTSESAVKFPIVVLLSGILFLISVGSYTSSQVEWLKFVALGAVAVGCPQIILRSIISLRRRLLDINVLIVAACAGAIAIGEYVEAGSIIFLFGLAQWLENKYMQKARNAITSFHELQPEFATLASTNEEIPVERIAVDHVLLVRPGDRVPVDGIIISGASFLDESMLTGESRPVPKKEDDVVCSGSLNCGNGSLQVKATTTAAESTVALVSKKVEEASATKSKTDRIIETFAKYYTPLIVFAAILVATVPLTVESSEWDEWLELALVLLVSACPCALVISTPVATTCGISKAARQSILIKGSGVLEMLSKLKGVSLDKTGTLTQKQFTVTTITTFANWTQGEVLRLAAQLEGRSSHPIAAAIVSDAQSKGLPYSTSTDNVITIPGGGLIRKTDNVNTAGVGTLEMLADHGFHTEHLEEMRRMEDNLGKQGKKACFVGQEGIVVGVIGLRDNIRDNAVSAMMTLSSMKLKLALLTGDGFTSAQQVAYSVGIPADQVYSKLRPEEKATVLRDLRLNIGHFGHVGDGVNDSIALAAADVGIAMGIGGSTMAIDAADVALFSNDLSSIPKAIRIGRRVTRTIYQNIIFALAVKVTVFVLALLDEVELWAAVAADVGSTVLVVLNSLRILDDRYNNKEQSRCDNDSSGLQRKKGDHFIS